MSYDIIGDIHGQADKLVNLLEKMGYTLHGKVWNHPSRQVIFVGDFIDRGLQQLETVKIARSMVNAGAALAVLGNHELNAIAWHTPHPERQGEYLRSHLRPNNRHQHEAFLNEVEHLPEIHKDIIDWFLTLPLWLDLPDIRIVHACWHQQFMDFLRPYLTKDNCIPLALMLDATTENLADKDTATPSIFKAVEAICKGVEITLPQGHTFTDKDGHERHRVRTRWWDTSAVSYLRQQYFLKQNDKVFPIYRFQNTHT